MRTITVIRLGTLCYLAFVIYGSLVPLDFVHLPMDQAIERFRNMPFLDLGIGSRADWVANLLLFIPLAFLGMSASASRQPLTRLLFAAALVAVGAGLSMGIEFTQIFFPPRTVSQNDVVAESLGAVIGTALGWRYGHRFEQFVADWRVAHGRSNLGEQLFWVYTLILIGYSVLPLDLTISPVEIYHKWNEGRLRLVPFSVFGGPPVEAVYQLAVDTVIWVPMALLLTLSSRCSPRAAFFWTIGIALGLELAQLIVYSRITDITDVLTAIPGAWLGSTLGRRILRKDAPTDTKIRVAPKLALIGTLTIVWTIILFAVFWYPFDFHLSPELVKQRLGLMLRVPFLAYYRDTEFRAITEVAHKVGVFLPLGALAGTFRLLLRPGPFARWFTPLILVSLFTIAFVIELGQVAMPLKSPDSTDLVLMWLGVSLGYFGATWIEHRWNSLPNPSTSRPASNMSLELHPADPTPARPDSVPGIYLIGQISLIALIYFAATSNFAPYNVKELLQPFPLLSVTVLTLGANVYFLAAAIAGHRLIRTPPAGVSILLILIVQGLLGYVVLRGIAPLESLDDILGYPVSSLPHELERLGRFLGLELPIAVIFMGGAAAWQALQITQPLAYVRWLALLLPTVALGHWIVVTQAATDNLTELMRDGGSIFSTYFLVLWGWIIAVTAYLMAASMARRLRFRFSLIGIAIATPLGYLLLTMALEPALFKYGRTFSALQFLLSPSRDRYVDPGQIPWLYALVHMGFTVAVAVAQYPRWMGAQLLRELRSKTAVLKRYSGPTS